MQIYAFIGNSGTGKSYRAQWVARENDLECIIDDGLLIKDNKVLAGLSAKKEKNKLASVRRAIFTEEQHRENVKNAIKSMAPDGILILGTSKEMIEKIVTALELPPIDKIIFIEDVATTSEINKAKYMRNEMGKHVIPVPTIEVKSQFSGYFLNPLKIFRSRGKD
jgi:ABC-type dipeptide/oligopeptide/nickel transport system ATPase component